MELANHCYEHFAFQKGLRFSEEKLSEILKKVFDGLISAAKLRLILFCQRRPMASIDLESSAPQGTHAQFQSTHWSLVLQAGDTALPQAQDALAKLCQSYWFPLYAFVRRKGNDSHQAKDLTQGFFLHLLESKLIKQAEREKGRFRTFLLTSLENFINDEWRRQKAAKRGGRVVTFSIDEDEAEKMYGSLPQQQADPTQTFDRAWAATVVEQALEELQQAYIDKGKLEVYQVLKRSVTGRLPSSSYAEEAAKLGLTKEALQVYLSRFKDAFGKAIRAEIRRIVKTQAEIEDELKYLMKAWAAHLESEL